MIYIYICIHGHLYTYLVRIYIYIYIERERVRDLYMPAGSLPSHKSVHVRTGSEYVTDGVGYGNINDTWAHHGWDGVWYIIVNDT